MKCVIIFIVLKAKYMNDVLPDIVRSRFNIENCKNNASHSSSLTFLFRSNEIKLDCSPFQIQFGEKLIFYDQAREFNHSCGICEQQRCLCYLLPR